MRRRKKRRQVDVQRLQSLQDKDKQRAVKLHRDNNLTNILYKIKLRTSLLNMLSSSKLPHRRKLLVYDIHHLLKDHQQSIMIVYSLL